MYWTRLVTNLCACTYLHGFQVTSEGEVFILRKRCRCGITVLVIYCWHTWQVARCCESVWLVVLLLSHCCSRINQCTSFFACSICVKNFHSILALGVEIALLYGNDATAVLLRIVIGQTVLPLGQWFENLIAWHLIGNFATYIFHYNLSLKQFI